MNVEAATQRVLMDQLVRELAESALPKGTSGADGAFGDLLAKAMSDAVLPKEDAR